MSILSELSIRFGAAFEAIGLDASYGEVAVARKPEFGDFQCNGALPSAKAAGRNPREIAQGVIDCVDGERLIGELSIAGPGFINIRVTNEALADWLDKLHDDDRVLVPKVSDPLNLIVDYGGPNVAKSMHVGHLRSTIIGNSLARLASFVGHDVTTDTHFGDWGTQMGIVLMAVKDQHPDLPYFDTTFEGEYPTQSPVTLEDLQVIYPEASQRNKTDADFTTAVAGATFELQQGRRGYRALWQHFVAVSLESQKQDFHALGVDFDLWYAESTVHDRIQPMIDDLVARGLARESRGALVVDVAEESDKAEIPPLLLSKSNGAYLYTSTDIGTVAMRVEDLHVDEIWYVVDGRQALHFEQVFRAAIKGGILPGSVHVEHLGFGTMNGPDGKPFQTRKGGVIRLAELIGMVQDAAMNELDNRDIASEYPEEERLEIARQVGLAALKYGDLINQRMTNYIFDLDRFTSFEGKTGPYLQYGAVRMGSLLSKAAEQGLTAGSAAAPTVEADRRLTLQMLRIPEIIERAYAIRAPNHIAEFAYELTADVNRFWEACHVLAETDVNQQASWLTSVEAAQKSLSLLLDLLGIEIPSRM